MENSNKKFDLKAIVNSRNKFNCKKCDQFPRPDVNGNLMKCASCTQLVCQKCCRNKMKCPLCQFESKNQMVPTFVIQSELMAILSGFKTYPCVNFKNGCLEEIPSNLNILRDHDQRCVFQKVPCLKLNCQQTFCFKDFDQHLEKFHFFVNKNSEWKFEGFPNELLWFEGL